MAEWMDLGMGCRSDILSLRLAVRQDEAPTISK